MASGKQYSFAVAALIASSVVWVIASLGALVTSGLSLGLGGLVLWIYVVSRLVPRMRPLKSATPRPTSAVALYLFIVPVAVALLQLILAGPVTEFSSNR